MTCTGGKYTGPQLTFHCRDNPCFVFVPHNFTNHALPHVFFPPGLEVSCILTYHTTPIILFLAFPCSLLQSFSGIIIIELIQGLFPEPYHGYAVLRVTQAEREKTQEREEEGRTITRIFHEVLRILSGPFYRAMVKPSTAEVQDKVRSNKRFFPYFRNCVGAVDGTHIPIAVTHQNDAHVPWRNRKGHVTQNVLGVVDFDLNFRYVLAGWEGSAHDSLVIRNAVERGFRAPEQGKYYLGDAGYTSLDGLLLVPYQKVRYHLREWRASGLRPETPEELFNHRHSCCRNAVERGFGVVKRRFAILRNSTGRQGFSIKTQVRIVYACVALHNFINKYYDVMKEADEMEREAERSGQGGMHMNVDDRTMPEEPDERRELIKRDMWRDYRR